LAIVLLRGDVVSAARYDSRSMSPSVEPALRLVACLALCATGCVASAPPRSAPSSATTFERSAAPSPRAAPSDEDEVLLRALARSASYLVRVCGPNGRFRYRIQLEEGRDDPGGYNVLRHAGTIYALADYQRRWPKPEVAQALDRALAYLRREYVAAVPEGSGMWAVWEEPAAEARHEAKLGGAGLVLVAMTTMHQVAPESFALDEARGLASFVAFLQEPDGRFHAKYFVGRGRANEWQSLYYPGEAALGLALLHERDPDTRWLEVAARGLAHLARERHSDATVPADHWAILATARLLSRASPLPGTSRDELLRHARQIGESILAQGPELDPKSPIHGSFDPQGRTTPTATRLEGLLALLPLLPQGDPLARRIAAAARAGVAFLLRAQVQEGPHAGAIPRAWSRLTSEPQDSAFNRRATEVRIDYVQHAMSAWMAYLDSDLAEASPTDAHSLRKGATARDRGPSDRSATSEP
jgi:hypothetical protein